MVRNRETKIELTAYDDLFQTDESRAEAALSKIRDIPLSEIDEFPDHPFKVLMDEDMEQLVESIKRNGVMTPATVRLKVDGRYELISGHRRKKACELAGLETLKCEVKDLTRDEAIIIMVESNLQRSVILPSEKAFAYKMRLEAMKRQGERTDLTSAPLVQKLTSREKIAEKSGDSHEQVRRFIRLTELAPEILQMVDEKQIAFRPAVEISYLAEEQQYTLLEAMSYNDATPSLAQAIKMKKFNQDGKLTDEVTAASMLLLALVFYLKYEAPPDERNFPMVMELLRAGVVREDDDSYVSPLDELFDRLEMVNPEHIALKYYRDYHSGSAKTLKSIQITLAARLEKFNLESLAGLTATDELDLPSLGEKKVALFALIPDNDTSFNFLVSILYTQLFQQLFYLADHKYGGSLPVHCHFIMDEFANVSLPDDFDKILSVMRSRGVSVSIILQNLAQLKALFEKQWESIVGNCDEFLYLGGNEQSTHKYVSELLGKETIDTNTYGKSSGRSGNYSTNYQISGRELMTPDEVRMLDNRYALLFIRGERPVMDFKYDIMMHPNVKLTADGGQPPYIHGEPTQAVATLVFDSDIPQSAVSVNAVSTSYELLSDEDLEEIFNI